MTTIRNTIAKFVEIAKEETVIRRMWGFGSRHKGEENSTSDLDLAIEVEWVSGQGLGVCEDDMSLWIATLPKFEFRLRNACPWELHLHQYAGECNSPCIHRYLSESSELTYDKTRE